MHHTLRSCRRVFRNRHAEREHHRRCGMYNQGLPENLVLGWCGDTESDGGRRCVQTRKVLVYGGRAGDDRHGCHRNHPGDRECHQIH